MSYIVYNHDKHAYGQLNRLWGDKITNEYNIFVREPWFSLIKSGIKKVEGRPNRGLFAKIKIGDIINFQNKDRNGIVKNVKTTVSDKIIYCSFQELIENPGIENILPGQGFDNVPASR
jgi:ASC-1-like (ASCH) protein